MSKASDNAFPSILITEGTEPSAPAAGKQRLYIDSTTHKLKRTDSSGTDVTIESTAAAFVGCKVYSNTTQALSASTFAAVNFNSEEFDTSTFHDTVTNNTRLTIPTTGYYLLTGYIIYVTIADRLSVLQQFYKNGTTALRTQPAVQTSTAGTTNVGLLISTIASLTATDYVELRAWRESAGNIGDAANTEQQNNFSAVYLGS